MVTQAAEGTAVHPGPRQRRGRGGLIRVAGDTCVVLGLVVLLFAAYQTWGKPAETREQQDRLERELQAQWDGRTGPQPAEDRPADVANPDTVGTDQSTVVGDGAPFARLAIPRLGLSWVVVEGVSLSDLRSGPGHYPATQQPGEVGNFAVAGHRSHGTFWDLDELGDGDAISVETSQARYTYRVYAVHIVSPTDTWVIAPDPENPDQAPQRRLLTLTTCHPQWGNWQRLIVHAELVNTEPKPSPP
ncbi:class E sortase [Saccharomonospora sp. NPDC046836]|uniref:class E sortase n=1 Tax=Saccharomonospora sp. NPDC046836 TaxID=3156921 RepID=UPI0033D5BAE3